MKQRMPRRYDAVTKTLKRLMDSKSERTRLQAALRMSDILLELERSNERKEIAIERAQTRAEIARSEASRPQETPAPVSTPLESEGDPMDALWERVISGER